jgi:hypothetical protein
MIRVNWSVLRVLRWHEAGDVTARKENPEVTQAYNVLVCVCGLPFCVYRRHFTGKHLLRKSFGWRGEISGKTLNLLSLRTAIPDHTCAVHNETHNKLSVTVTVQHGQPVCPWHLTTQDRGRSQVVLSGICVERCNTRAVSLPVLPFPLPLSSHQRSTLFFIYRLLLSEGKRIKSGNLSKSKAFSEHFG